MGAVLIVQVQNQNHALMRQYEEPIDEPLLQFFRSEAGKRVRYTDFVLAYHDAMLNHFQILAWLEDLPKALLQPDLPQEQIDSVQRVLAAAKEAEELFGYLFFEG